MSVVMAMAQNRTNPDVADYFIKGYLSIERGNNGKPVYKLSNIQKQGINFDDPGSIMRGYETPDEDVLFQFSHYDILSLAGVSKPDINTPLDFWRYDESIQEWQPDGETRQASRGVEENKSMVLMLVLDCSSSLRSDFSFVQEAAKAFIKSLLDASGKGNIKIGIVGFSKISATEFYPITRLTNDSYYDMCRFINSRSIQNGTALYYAMDKAIDVMEDYCNTSIPSNEPLSAAMMVTFTDGLDQTSRDEDRGIFTADKYYAELLNKLKGKRFNGIPLQSKMRGVQGDDIETQAQLGKFEQIGNSLAEFKLLNNVSELGQEFKDIAEGLLNEWAVLNCYVPNSFEGRVAWTYRTAKRTVESPREPRQPRERSRFFFGINAGIGPSFYNCYDYTHYQPSSGYVYSNDNTYTDMGLGLSGGIDLAFPIGRAVNLGVYGSAGFETASESFLLNAGPLLLINFRNNTSLYLGGGVSMLDFDYPGLDLRAGFKFKNGLYLFGELFSNSYSWDQERSFYIVDGYEYNYYYNYYEEYGHYEYYEDYFYRNVIGILFHIGYSF